MRRLIVSIVLALGALSPDVRAGERACAADPALSAFDGHYISEALRVALRHYGAWYPAMTHIDADTSALTVRDGRVYLNRAWHERDEGDFCVRQQDDGLYVESREGETLAGPFHPIARLDESEAHAYLTQIISGCFDGSDGKTWCFTREGIRIDGQPSSAELQLDLSELPDYGTALKVDDTPPFLILLRRGAQWWVFKDDWASSEGYVPVDTDKDKPAVVLTPRPQ